MTKTGIALLTAVLATPTFAFNMRYLKEAPITRLNEAEVRAFKAFVSKTLEEGADGTTVDWKAPKTVFTSQVTPTRSFTDGNRKCREATIESHAGERQERGKYVFCKDAKGEWQFSLPSTKKPVK